MIKTYYLDIKVERISNGFNVKVNSSDQDGMNKFYPDMETMKTDLNEHFSNKLEALEGDYMEYMSKLLKPGDIIITHISDNDFSLQWDLENKDLNPKDYVIEYNINNVEWLSDAKISDKKYWDDERRTSSAIVTLPSSPSDGDTVEFRIKGTHDGFPDSAWSEVVSLEYNAG